MKSKDIVFFNRFQKPELQTLYRESEYNRPFLPVTTRPRSDRWSYGNRTIGGYKSYTLPGKGRTDLTPQNVWEGRWVWEWIDPRNINVTMDEVFAMNARAHEAAKARQAEAAKKQREIKAQFANTGLTFQSVMEILGYPERDDYRRRMLLRGERTSFYLSADMLCKLITEAQLAVPEVAHARQQAEVEAALALLG